MAITEFIGFILLWTGLSPVKTRRGNDRLAVLFLCAAYLICGTHAPAFVKFLEAAGGWDCVVARAFCMTLIVVLGF
ncbi:hypothetical protein DIJ64_11815 [Mycobacterium leprae]|uniref:Uncharacterized protein n=1 Tax=Mycobacterium leprae TaxID=1769 RepID=A0AAD0KT92_MYCLR|nr:hypothetical protein [Mycobacterium leprae]AWV48494.1 hypothetical protein DIJ64_11815 [Mycobacterium leprae]OAR19971.1 hypothetical protein A8144_03150 [Mycobacterium leprae 3125609]OAX70951.1 hypothetical protein A3216_08970 [Mycobacterium leprae 7935681]